MKTNETTIKKLKERILKSEERLHDLWYTTKQTNVLIWFTKKKKERGGKLKEMMPENTRNTGIWAFRFMKLGGPQTNKCIW